MINRRALVQAGLTGLLAGAMSRLAAADSAIPNDPRTILNGIYPL
jgi:hypothetical protein